MTVQGYDLVGDIHGHADALHRLLRVLDYAEIEGVFRHPERKMIFVGDFIDRGPEQLEVLRIARAMCEAGVARAVMGNHEFNAIGWAAQNGGGEFLRSHSAKMRTSTSNFLVKSERTLGLTRMPSAGSEPCRSGSIFPTFASSMLAGTTPRVRH
jgi:Calcineurin-like phosphoesterase